MVYLETVYLGWRPQAVSWAQHILDARWPSSAQQVMELLDKVVDKTLAFIAPNVARISRRLTSISLPVCAIYSTAETGSWVKWQVPAFEYAKNVPFFNLVVPTVDSTRLKFVVKADVEGGFHVLVGGNSGVGKTLTVLDFLEQTEEKYVWQAKSFSAQTSARALQAFFEEKLEKIRKNLLGPPSGKTFLFFVDDLNMPMTETYGAQPPIELLRQIINQKDDRNGGFYDLKKIGLFKVRAY